MKKFLFIAFGMCLFSIGSHAQTAMTNPNGLTLDTVTNATAEGPVLQVLSYQSTVSIVVVVTKISGTVGGNIEWQGSNDGVNYATIDTTAVADATKNYQWSASPKKFLYYKANVAGTGTMSASYKATLYTTLE